MTTQSVTGNVSEVSSTGGVSQVHLTGTSKKPPPNDPPAPDPLVLTIEGGQVTIACARQGEPVSAEYDDSTGPPFNCTKISTKP